jgi:hypothetical protein
MTKPKTPRFICQIFRHNNLLWQNEVTLSNTTSSGTFIEHFTAGRNVYVDVVPYCLKLLETNELTAEYQHQLYCVVTKFGKGIELTDNLTVVIERVD